MSETNGFTLTDLEMLRACQARSQALYASTAYTLADGSEHTIECNPDVSNRMFLIGKGFNPDKVDRFAISLDYAAITRVGYYPFMAVDSLDMPAPREYLTGEGYPPYLVDAHLREIAAQDALLEQQRIAREAYERTWRYKARRAYIEARERITLAADVLRGRHDCDGW